MYICKKKTFSLYPVLSIACNFFHEENKIDNSPNRYKYVSEFHRTIVIIQFIIYKCLGY